MYLKNNKFVFFMKKKKTWLVFIKIGSGLILKW